MFWLIKRNFIFYHTHFHEGYLDACEKTVYILVTIIYYDKTKKAIVSNNDADHLRVIASVNLTHHIQTYTTPPEVQVLM